jgi:hypothetical protein
MSIPEKMLKLKFPNMMAVRKFESLSYKFNGVEICTT